MKWDKSFSKKTQTKRNICFIFVGINFLAMFSLLFHSTIISSLTQISIIFVRKDEIVDLRSWTMSYEPWRMKDEKINPKLLFSLSSCVLFEYAHPINNSKVNDIWIHQMLDFTEIFKRLNYRRGLKWVNIIYLYYKFSIQS